MSNTETNGTLLQLIRKLWAWLSSSEQAAQLFCRWQSAVCSFATVVGIMTYALFSIRFLGYGQRELSLTQSSAAAIALATNLVMIPRLIERIGEAAVCTVGLLLLGTCLPASSLFATQPLHVIFFLLSRMGLALADTTTAALTAQYSTAEHRGRNLALLQSTQVCCACAPRRARTP